MIKQKPCILLALSLLSVPALGDTTKDEWRAEMERRLEQLERRQRLQEAESAEKDRIIEALRRQRGNGNGDETAGWLRDVDFSGLIEVEGSRVSPQEGSSSSDIKVATVELGVATRVNDWVGGELLLLYEEESDNDGDLNIDTALVTLSPPGADWFIKAGRGTLPFGAYPTYMISDPLTLELGETNDTAVEAGYAVEGLNFSLFLFQGDHSDKVDDLGAQFGYQARREGFTYGFNLGYLNNLAESNGIVDGGWISDDDKRPGWVVSLEFGLGPWNLIGEYLAASKGFADAGGDEPAAYNLEAAYAFEGAGRPWILAVGYQATDDAAGVQWGLPEKRLLGSLSLELMRQTRIGIEYRGDRDYAGDRSDTLTAQLAVTF